VRVDGQTAIDPHTARQQETDDADAHDCGVDYA
jgi:hypothetical protein